MSALKPQIHEPISNRFQVIWESVNHLISGLQTSLAHYRETLVGLLVVANSASWPSSSM